MKTKHKKRVGVLRGGPSSEFEVSLKTGQSVLKNLPEKYEAVDIFVDKEGVWYIKGVAILPNDAHKYVDVVFNAMHGEYGEDGEVQRILEHIHMPFTGSGSLSSAIGMNKHMAKKIFKKAGIKVPHGKILKKENYEGQKTARELFNTFPIPAVLKPVDKGSSVGVFLVETLKDLTEALEKIFEDHENVLIEEYIKGKEATCGVLEYFRGKKHYALLPIEIIPKSHQKFFNFESKYSIESGADEICPGNFSKKESELLQELAILTHKAIGARHYSRTDFIIHPKRGIYVLEINTLPGLTEQSLLPKAITAIGSSYGELLEHLIETTFKSS